MTICGHMSTAEVSRLATVAIAMGRARRKRDRSRAMMSATRRDHQLPLDVIKTAVPHKACAGQGINRAALWGGRTIMQKSSLRIPELADKVVLITGASTGIGGAGVAAIVFLCERRPNEKVRVFDLRGSAAAAGSTGGAGAGIGALRAGNSSPLSASSKEEGRVDVEL